MPGKVNKGQILREMKKLFAALSRVSVEEVRVASCGTTLTFSIPTTEAEEEKRVTEDLLQAVQLRSQLGLTKTLARDKLPRHVPQHLVEQARKALYTTIPVQECKACVHPLPHRISRAPLLGWDPACRRSWMHPGPVSSAKPAQGRSWCDWGWMGPPSGTRG